MNRNGNTYTVLYAAIMVILVAAVLASVSMALKPKQVRNTEIEKKQSILASVKIESTVENAVFESVNSFVLGDVVQSMNIIGANAYVLVNGSAKIEVATIADMKSVATIDVVSPRFIAKVSDTKAYVTDWGINGVQVIDLAANTVTSTISCGTGPEGIAVSNDKIYIVSDAEAKLYIFKKPI